MLLRASQLGPSPISALASTISSAFATVMASGLVVCSIIDCDDWSSRPLGHPSSWMPARDGPAYDQEEGRWFIEKRFPSGSEKVAEIPQGYSSGCACLNSTPFDFNSAKAFLQSST